MARPKGQIIAVTDRQERLFAFIESRGDQPFTVHDVTSATGLPHPYVSATLVNRFNQGHLAHELVGRNFQYRMIGDGMPVRACYGEVSEFVWQALRAANQPMLLSAIRHEVEVFSGKTQCRQSISVTLYHWYCTGFLRREGTKRSYRYSLTETARTLLARPLNNSVTLSSQTSPLEVS